VNGSREKAARLLEAALARPPVERPAFVEVEADGDGELRDEVLSLLGAATSGADFFDRLAARLEPAGAPLRGQRIGPWRVLDEIGRGGMGVVHRAERADGQYEQVVALKTLSLGLRSAGAVARFRNERRILARLEHPHIARLIDGGVTGDRTPWLAMEYVDGTPIDRWIAERNPSVAERLHLFLAVCSAVRYAHTHLVVHRDIKPGNVFVTAEGEVKLLDFGISKALDADPGAELTQEGAAVLTPAYAAPEVLRGEGATTQGDVYSLGLLLFELLTGRPAHPTAPGLHIAALLDRPVPPPSQSVDDRVLARRLAGDLDTIVLEATAEDPERRYASVEQLANDVQRHLSNEPVLAHRPSIVYAARKFVRRHWLPSAFAAVAVAGVALGVGAVLQGAAQTRAQNRLILAERDRANEVQAFLVDVFSLSTPEASRGETVTARELLDNAAERVRGDLADRPLVQAQMLRAIGQAYTSLSLYPQAQAALEDALAVGETLWRDRSEPTAAVLHDLATVLERQGAYHRAEALAARALRLSEGSPDTAVDARARLLYARILHRQDRMDEAAPHYDLALARARALDGADPELLADVVLNYGSFMLHRGETARSVALTREGLALREALFGPDDVRVVEPLNNLATALASDGAWEEAAEGYRRALAINEGRLAPMHQTNAFLWNGLARAEWHLGRIDDARQSFDRGIAVLRANFGDVHPDLGITLANRGRLEFEQGRLEAARGIFDEALGILDEALAGHWIGHDVRRRLGTTIARLGRPDEGRVLIETAHAALEGRLGEDHEATREARADLEALGPKSTTHR
jgi:tetratricopeptide (TPR) repeat protein